MQDQSAEQNRELIEQVARQIGDRKLATPALLFLEVIKPFSFLASQGLLLAEPLLSFLYEEPRIGDYAELLADRSNVEHLMVRLEQEGLGRDGGSKGEG
jgi:hypothetical protein